MKKLATIIALTVALALSLAFVACEDNGATANDSDTQSVSSSVGGGTSYDSSTEQSGGSSSGSSGQGGGSTEIDGLSQYTNTLYVEDNKDFVILNFTDFQLHDGKSTYTAFDIIDTLVDLKRKPKALSGGQRQRVAIGRAIVRNPKVFLMDEPLSNLDAKLRNQMRAEIIELRKKIRSNFIYVTHDQVEAMTLGDRIVIMKDGFVQQIGTPKEVFNNPVNLFVAGFIGAPQMNFFDARLINHGNADYSVQFNDVLFPLSENTCRNLRSGLVESQDIVLGVRPEHVVLTKGGETSVKAKVEISEMMGSEYQIHVTVAGKDVIIRVRIMELDKDIASAIENGGEISFTFTPDVMHIFNKDTGVSLL